MAMPTHPNTHRNSVATSASPPPDDALDHDPRPRGQPGDPESVADRSRREVAARQGRGSVRANVADQDEDEGECHGSRGADG
jgi:hypothetical protein